MALIERVRETGTFLKNRIDPPPSHAITLGTGLKDIPHQFTIQDKIPLADIPHFPAMTVHHMEAFLYLVEYQTKFAWMLGGRLHYYEGHSMDEVTFPIRAMAEAGTEKFFFTNAAGNVNPAFKAGDLLLIRDHINWSFPSPLIGTNEKSWGPRYPEMIDVYDPVTNNALLNIAKEFDFQLDTGVYLGLTGPQLETPSEYRLFRHLGADMVGMSTIPEVIVAAHMNRWITALSVLSNDAVEHPVKGATHIPKMIKNIENRQDDVAELIRHWLMM